MTCSGHTFIIAEAGVNHNGNLDLALQLVEAAAAAEADAVKFQTFRAGSLVSCNAPKAHYQTKTTDSSESQFEMIRRLELDEDAHIALAKRCRDLDIEFLSTPFDLESLDLLVNRMGISRVKLPSGEITNAPLLLQAAATGKEIILSTGMCTLGDIEDALGVIAFGYLGSGLPSMAEFRSAYCSVEGQALLQEKVTLLHCTTEYPAPFADVNLRSMDTLRRAFGLPVGFSDHTEGIAIPVAAVARGAVLVEKHFTLDRNSPGPDHKASLEPSALKEMVRSIRQVEKALGTSLKRPTSSEVKNVCVARKSLVAARAIAAGEKYCAHNVIAKRPGCGISPMKFWDMIGRTASRNYAVDEAISDD